MRHRRIRLICRWAGVVILVLVAFSFVRRITVVWMAGPALTPVGYAEFDCGIFTIIPDAKFPGPTSTGFYFNPSFYQYPMRWYFVGEYWSNPGGGLALVTSGLIIPATVPFGLSAALIGFSYWRRHPKGHCAKCGYDLTGIADKCPECGAAAKAVKP